MLGPREPALKEGVRRGHDEKREAKAGEEDTEKPRDGSGSADEVCDRGEGDSHGEYRQRDQQKNGVDSNFGGSAMPSAEHLSIRVTRQQHELKEKHAGVPYDGEAAQVGEKNLAHHGLNRKEEK